MKILLIEDDPDVSETIISVLTSFFKGVEIEQIVDGVGFRKEKWKEVPWSLVIWI